MFKEFCTLGMVLIFGLLSWAVYERQQWDQDYTRYQAASLDLPPFDSSYQQHIQPSYFKHATVITNDTHLRCPQDIEVSSKGVIYTGLIDGSIVTVTPDSNQTTTIAHHPETGRVYGIVLTSDDSTLYYVTQYKGLVRLDTASGKYQYLLNQIEGKKIGYLNSVSIDQVNQILYITESGPIRMKFSSKETLLAHKEGRIIKYNLKTQTASILLQGIAFPNGIVYQQKSNSIIYSELTRHKIWKFSLSTSKHTLLVDNYFGLADNLKLSDSGDLLVGTITTRDSLQIFLQDKPFLRKLLLNMPERLVFALTPKRAGGVRVDTSTGEIKEYMFGGPVKISYVTTIVQKKGKMYFSSLTSPTILILDSSKDKNEKRGSIIENEL